MLKLILFSFLIAPLASATDSFDKCQPLYESSEQLIDSFYIEDSFEQGDLGSLEKHLASTKSCADKIWNLRLQTMELYIVLLSQKTEGKVIIDPLNDNWSLYLSEQNFLLNNMNVLEGFSEFLNGIRLQYKILDNGQRAKKGKALQELQLHYSQKVIDANNGNKWVLYNQHLNSQLNHLSHIDSYEDQDSYCEAYNNLKSFMRKNQQYFTPPQIEAIEDRYSEKYLKICN